ncbi:hypothetical protein CEUSTIGMA_g5993.t1 [Chlamydomonas eustigma]|uniref:CMP/dCMP-type deaminase domain-containing protein n=1 Tax=Chlamydomonas eustigma TaxID=1157962 RepID=A0A250X652_9CHLO|nr:hypothetical protein CEUSTIGMA_g5993.t1 [Chlamydomonas eustigma]|eukprot:GAX78553.1 hypothetical protein CEUSTIGMA_g5993.t1 [Chlamydomonas eustigma]
MINLHLNTFGWKYNSELGQDVSLLDLTSLLTRNSHCQGGSMGCVIVRDPHLSSKPGHRKGAADINVDRTASQMTPEQGTVKESSHDVASLSMDGVASPHQLTSSQCPSVHNHLHQHQTCSGSQSISHDIIYRENGSEGGQHASTVPLGLQNPELLPFSRKDQHGTSAVSTTAASLASSSHTHHPQQGIIGSGTKTLLMDDGVPTILAMAINTPLFSTNSSDVHAEMNALAACSKKGISTQDTTAYITMPPCKNCFMLLQACGVKRIVTRKPFFIERVTEAAGRLGIELVVIPDDEAADARRKALVAAAAASVSHQPFPVATATSPEDELLADAKINYHCRSTNDLMPSPDIAVAVYMRKEKDDNGRGRHENRNYSETSGRDAKRARNRQE